ncbi:MAG: hypothetical protein KDK39_09550 [Leptospiraceae bacterium]|nr:hypothetical protein [Leptospiraceae bacterium]
MIKSIYDYVAMLAVQSASLWARFFLKQGRGFTRLAGALDAWQWVYLAGALGLLVSAAPHWIAYSVNFNGPGSWTIGSEQRLFFFGTGLCAFFFWIFRFWRSRLIAMLIFTAAALLYVSGLFFPRWIHTRFQTESDFHLILFWVVLYGLSLGLLLTSAWRALAQPWIGWSEISQWLLAREALAESDSNVGERERLVS